MIAKIAKALLGSTLFATVQAASSSTCKSSLTTKATPSVAAGFQYQLVANGLNAPRGIKFDKQGNLLVVESGNGAITALKISDDGSGCLSSPSRKTVIPSGLDLNHGIEMAPNGDTLYASSTESAYSWSYDGSSQKNTSGPTTLVTNMTNTDHTTRTLLLSKKVPGLMVVTRGSTSNIDPLAMNISTGHSQVKAFNLKNMTGAYDFDTHGLLLGWGLRNDVGVDEDPVTGAIYTVENSVDQTEHHADSCKRMHRDGVDIHQTNPSEELNMLGYLNGTYSSNQGRNFGYPGCYTAWDISTIPHYSGEVGQQFAIGNNANDSKCVESVVQKARLGFHPHMAPLDILFNSAGSEAWVTFHGSWDSQPAVGYKLSMVAFANGEPTEPSTSKTAAVDVFWNANTGDCANQGATCFRPVGLDWDSKGRLWMSSDTTGEVYVISKVGGGGVNNATSTSTSGSGSGGGSSSSTSSSAGGASVVDTGLYAMLFGIAAYFI